MRLALVTIPGLPVAKERPRKGKHGFYTPGRTRAYEETVATYAMSYSPMPSVPLGVTITIQSKNRLRGDLDNYAKSVLDGLVKGRLIPDDRLVESLTIQQAYSEKEQAVYAEVWELDQSQVPLNAP